MENQEKITKYTDFNRKLVEKAEKWGELSDPDLPEAINDVCGNLFVELRKMTKKICDLLEESHVSDQIKQKVKDEINLSWYNIESKQSIGIDKLCLVIKRKNNNND